jgi:hypothetical protein
VSVAYEIGTYACRVVEQGFQVAKTGRPMIVFKVEPVEKIDSHLDEAGEIVERRSSLSVNYQRTVRLVIVEDNQESLDYTMAKLRYAGFEGDRFEDLDLVGSEVRCLCKHQPYNGQPSEQWELSLPPRQDRPLETDGNLTRKLNALFGRRLKEGAEPSDTAPRAHTSAPKVEIDDSDIPFAVALPVLLPTVFALLAFVA